MLNKLNIDCREELAKAKRLARFNVELSRPIEKMGDFSKQKTSSYRQNHASLAEHNALEPAEEANRSSVSDIEVSESSPVVVGLCPDMCPGSFNVSFNCLHMLGSIINLFFKKQTCFHI